jgi:hypothetical protein
MIAGFIFKPAELLNNERCSENPISLNPAEIAGKI